MAQFRVGAGNCYVQQHDRARHDEMLRRAVDKVRPTVDNRQPCAQLPPIGKRDLARKQAAVDAALADKMMILNIAREMQRPASLTTLDRKGPTSLNLDRRRRDMGRIDQENGKMLRRLEGVKSSYSVGAQRKSYAESRKHVAIASAKCEREARSYPAFSSRHSSASRQGSAPRLDEKEFEAVDDREGRSHDELHEEGLERHGANRLPVLLPPPGRSSPAPGRARQVPPRPPQRNVSRSRSQQCPARDASPDVAMPTAARQQQQPHTNRSTPSRDSPAQRSQRSASPTVDAIMSALSSHRSESPAPSPEARLKPLSPIRRSVSSPPAQSPPKAASTGTSASSSPPKGARTVEQKTQSPHASSSSSPKPTHTAERQTPKSQPLPTSVITPAEELPTACESQGSNLEKAILSNDTLPSEAEKTVDISMRIGSPKVLEKPPSHEPVEEEENVDDELEEDDLDVAAVHREEATLPDTATLGAQRQQPSSPSRSNAQETTSPSNAVGISPAAKETKNSSKGLLSKSKSMGETYGEDEFDEYEDEEFDEDASDDEEDAANRSKASASCSKKSAVERSAALSAPLSQSATVTPQVDRPGSAGSAVSARSARSQRSQRSARSSRSRSSGSSRSRSSGSSRSRSGSRSRSASSRRSARSPVSVRSAHDSDDEKNET